MRRKYRPTVERLDSRIVPTVNINPFILNYFIPWNDGNTGNVPNMTCLQATVGMQFHLQVVLSDTTNTGKNKMSSDNWTASVGGSFSADTATVNNVEYSNTAGFATPMTNTIHGPWTTAQNKTDDDLTFDFLQKMGTIDLTVTCNLISGGSVNWIFRFNVVAPTLNTQLHFTDAAGNITAADPVFGWVGNGTVIPINAGDWDGLDGIGFAIPRFYYASAVTNTTLYSGRFGYLQTVVADQSSDFDDGRYILNQLNKTYDDANEHPITPMFDGSWTNNFYQDTFWQVGGGGVAANLPDFPNDPQKPADRPNSSQVFAIHGRDDTWPPWTFVTDYHVTINFVSALVFVPTSQAGNTGIPIALSTKNWTVQVDAHVKPGADPTLGASWVVDTLAGGGTGSGDKILRLAPTWFGDVPPGGAALFSKLYDPIENTVMDGSQDESLTVALPPLPQLTAVPVSPRHIASAFSTLMERKVYGRNY